MNKTSYSKIYIGRNYHRNIVIILGLDEKLYFTFAINDI